MEVALYSRSYKLSGGPPKGCRRSKTKVAKKLKVAKGLSTAHNGSHDLVMTTLFDLQIWFVDFDFMKLMSHGNQAEAMSFLQDGVQESLGPRGPVAVPQASSLQGKHNPQAESKAPQAPQACAQPIDATALLGGEFLCADGASSINQNGALVFPVFLPCTDMKAFSCSSPPAPRGLDR